MNAFTIGYEAFKSGEPCIPAQNAKLQELLKNCQDWTGQSIAVMKEFKAGVNKASNEWEEEFLANA